MAFLTDLTIHGYSVDFANGARCLAVLFYCSEIYACNNLSTHQNSNAIANSGIFKNCVVYTSPCRYRDSQHSEFNKKIAILLVDTAQSISTSAQTPIEIANPAFPGPFNEEIKFFV